MKNPTSEILVKSALAQVGDLTPEERAELVRQYEESEDEGRVIPPGGCCIACLGCGCLFWIVLGIIVLARVIGHFFINHTI